MRLYEFASAEEQLALWKLISDKTWAAIQQQAEQQAREKAERAAKAKSTKSKKMRGGRTSLPLSIPNSTPPKLPPAPQEKTTDSTSVDQPAGTKGDLPNMGPFGAANTPVVAPPSAPLKPVAPSTAAQQKLDAQLKLSAKRKGVVEV